MQQLLDLIAEMIAILLAEAKEKPELVDAHVKCYALNVYLR